jgi:hypothetical protein
MFLRVLPESANDALFRAHGLLELFVQTDEFRLIASTERCQLRLG